MQRLTATLLSATIAALLLASAPASADEPVLTILQPTGTVYLPTFPAVVPVQFQVDHSPINGLNVLRVEVDGVQIGDVGNPFGQPTPICFNPATNAPFTACSIDGGNTQATVGLNWTVPSPGTYSLVVSARHGSVANTGSDDETVQFIELTVEYPAPPAVANAYLNSGPKLPKGNVRGCIISAIAELHAKDSAYGPKGGPYDEAAIRADVDGFRLDCGG